MGVTLVVAVTDLDWFDMLHDRHQREPLDDVNFWSPSPKSFRALRPGELFLFRLKAPRNKIAGGGIFTHASILPCNVAWDAFGQANGAESAYQLRTRIAQYRRDRGQSEADFRIGCRILTCPFFWPEEDWIPAPSWSRNIVALKRYEAKEPDGRSLWDAVIERQTRFAATDPKWEPAARYGKPQLVKPRLGQGAFRVQVVDTYARRCAVTREATLPALEAAHIKPFSEGGPHDPQNGLLLRRDIHSLFDSGYVTVSPDLRFEVSRRIREEFENGRDYYRLHGQSVWVPTKADLKPDPRALSWHNQHCFR